MKSRSTSTTYAWITVILIALVILVFAGWANLQLVRELPQESIFLRNWEITRGFIFRGENPYNNTEGIPFTSPLPVILLYSPFALINNFQIARAAWITVNQVAAIIFAVFCIRITSWQTNRWLVILTIIFAIFWFASFSVYIKGSLTALSAVLFTGAMFAIQEQNDEIGGILIGLAALQPGVTLMGVLLVFLWAVSHRRWILIFWAGVVFLFFSGVGMIFLPEWPLDFFWTVLRHVDFRPGRAIIETTSQWWPGVGLQVGWGIFFLALITMLVEWWFTLGKDYKRLIWVLGLTFILSIWIGIETSIDNVFMLLLSLVAIFMAWNRRWGRSGQIFVIIVIGLLLPGLWWAFIVLDRQAVSGPMNPILMIGFPFLTLVGLYWVRWWFLRPAYLIEEDIFNE